LRLFFALWPTAATAHALAQWAGEVQRDAGGRATAEETIHLTLAFLGDADRQKATSAGRKVRADPFEMKIDSANYWKHNRIVWVGPAQMPPELQALVQELHRSLKQDGFALEDRPFAAHISLIRKANPPKSIPPLPRVEWPAREFLLVRSVPTGRGSRYEAVERFPLHGNP
jgi:2'-5' RNA ligase